MYERTRILVIEDHPLYRDGLVDILRRCPSAPEAFAARDAAQARAMLAGTHDFDVVISDWRLPDADGLDLLHEIGKSHPTTARVLMSGTDDPRLTALCMDAGLMGYFPKSLEPAALQGIVERLLEGEAWFPARAASPKMLSPRQTEILEAIAAGKTNKEIAREVGITERTVKHHLTAVFERLGTTRRSEAASRAIAEGLIQTQKR